MALKHWKTIGIGFGGMFVCVTVAHFGVKWTLGESPLPPGCIGAVCGLPWGVWIGRRLWP